MDICSIKFFGIGTAIPEKILVMVLSFIVFLCVLFFFLLISVITLAILLTRRARL